MYRYKKMRAGAVFISMMFIVLCFSGCFSKPVPQEFGLSESSVTLDLNQYAEIQVAVNPEDADLSQVEFLSEDSSVATFEKIEEEGTFRGKITGLEEGTTAVYVKCGEVESEKIEVIVEDKERIENERKEKAQEVSDLISEIGEVDLKSSDKIQEARGAYDSLEKESKEYVSNYSLLTEAEEKYKELKDAALADADEVSEAINKIDDVTLESEAAIIEARNAYDALDEDVKPFVKNYSTLSEAEETLTELKEKAAAEAEAQKKEQEELEQQSSGGADTSGSSGSYNGQTDSSSQSGSSSSSGRTVYWTPNGEKYHYSGDCPTLSRSKTIYSGSVEEAQANGKSEKCKVCS